MSVTATSSSSLVVLMSYFEDKSQKLEIKHCKCTIGNKLFKLALYKLLFPFLYIIGTSMNESYMISSTGIRSGMKFGILHSIDTIILNEKPGS